MRSMWASSSNTECRWYVRAVVYAPLCHTHHALQHTTSMPTSRRHLAAQALMAESATHPNHGHTESDLQFRIHSKAQISMSHIGACQKHIRVDILTSGNPSEIAWHSCRREWALYRAPGRTLSVRLDPPRTLVYV